MIGARYVHKKRSSTYSIIGVVKSMSAMMEDGDFFGTLLIDEQKYEDVMVQISNGNHDGPWWIYENHDGMKFVRPASEFTPDRFERIET